MNNWKISWGRSRIYENNFYKDFSKNGLRHSVDLVTLHDNDYTLDVWLEINHNHELVLHATIPIENVMEIANKILEDSDFNCQNLTSN